MSIEKTTENTGLFERTRTKYTGKHLRKGMREVLEAWTSESKLLEAAERDIAKILKRFKVTWPAVIPPDAPALLRDAVDAKRLTKQIRLWMVNNVELAVSASIRLGTLLERMQIRPREPEIAKGLRALSNCKKGLESQWGSEQERDEDARITTDDYLKAKREHPKWKPCKLLEEVASFHGISPRTVRRRLKRTGTKS